MSDEPREDSESASSEAPAEPRAKKGGLGGLLRHSVNYSLVPLVHKALAVAMLPLFTDWLSEDQYGAVFMTDVVLMVLVELLGAHLLNGMLRYYFVAEGERQRNAVVSSTILVIGMATSLVCVAGLLFRGPLTPILLGRPAGELTASRLTEILTIGLLILPISLTSQAGFYYLQILKRSALHSGVKLTKMILELGLKILFVGGMGMGVPGYFLAVLIGELLTSVVLTGWVLWQVRPRLDWAVLAPIVRYTLPLVPVGIFQLGIHQLDRRLLEALSPEDVARAWVGIYGLGYTVGAMANQLVNAPFFTIWQPWIFAESDPDARAKLMARVTTYAVLAVTTSSLALTFYGREAVQLLASKEGFYAASAVVPWVTAGYVFWALYASAQLSFYIEKRTKPLVWINLAALVANLALNLALIPSLGYVGPAVASLLTYGTLAGIAMAVARATNPIPFQIRRLGIVLGTMLVGSALTLWVDEVLSERGHLVLPAALALKTGLLSTLLFALWRWALGAEERAGLQDWIRVRIGALQGR